VNVEKFAGLFVGVEEGKIRDGWCAVKDFKATSVQLKKDGYKSAKKIIKRVKKEVKKDPKLINKALCDAAGHKVPKLYDGATDVQLTDQNYLLTICPRTIANAGALFDAALQRNVKLFVSAHQMDEAEKLCNHFWKNKALSKMSLKGGWKIKKVAKKVLAEGAKESGGTRVPRIIESTLKATKGHEKRILTHLHYDGWRNGKAMPDEKLLHVLHDRMQELSPSSTVPISINCRAGVGRTGAIAIGHHIRKEIDRHLAAGKKLDDISINVPALLYAFRKQRENVLRQGSQLAQIYSVIGDHYAKLKAHSA